ncbi:MlaD family protein [Lysobacter korlensis]|uniref:MlaD family protein n=1 Tax=Lysobacter korlensis TaxID=553636 RepID=A0ABV6RKG9_9GAMM
METKANYVLIGAFTLLASIALLLFALWAAKYSSEKSWQTYTVVFDEPVTGLSEGSLVQYNGIAVGTISELKLSPRDPRRVLAKLRVQDDAPVKADTRAKMSMSGITGSPFIQLTGGSPASPRLDAVDTRESPIIRTEASALQNIADTANRLVARLDELLSAENVARVTNTLENIETMTETVAEQREDLRAVIINTRQATAQLEATATNANEVVKEFDREFVDELPALVVKLDRTLTRLEATAEGAQTIVEENRAPIRTFTRDGLAQVGPTLSELRVLIRDLRRVSDGLDGGAADYLLGRDGPKEFEPK